ncbi:hypothetical protein PV396_39655 [Streptomyces sp. ME02-8801-2C]|uniref:hypothetical protein n=1 Tax=Streptomyces sp. ME02-8801-2C TaxID=3028680 RepID=UPI0029B9A0DF|nr:hypothetical protein [Streptomyces sp. ME02-8801-2C]MDX3457997.1 hypothetical protein [Streptomyces sp. ME02-8801-2C]
METGTSSDVRPTHEAVSSGDNLVVPPGPRQLPGVGTRQTDSPDQESNIVLGED